MDLRPEPADGRAGEEPLRALIARARDGDRAARDALFAAAYPELRRLAHARLYRGGRNTVLDTTALVHESYVRLAQAGTLALEDRRAFFAYASRVMRSVIVDSARARMADRRGGGAQRITLDPDAVEDLCAGDAADIVRVHEALQALEQADARAARVVEMRWFGGWGERDIAEALEVTERTVQRDWEKARMLLRALLGPGH